MDTARILFRTCCLAAAFVSQATGQIANFADDFEGFALDPYWTPYTLSGTITFPSTAQVRGGRQSLQLNTNNNGPNKEVGIVHVFPQPTYGRVSVWMFDTGAGVQSSNYMGLLADPFGLFTWDFDLGIGQGDTYGFVAPGIPSGRSGIRRTQAWHQFEIESWPGNSRIRIDGTTVHTGPGGAPFKSIKLNMNAPSWRPAWVSYFDDFFFIAPVPAAYALFGLGCVGSNGVPTLVAPATGPRLGTTHQLTIHSLPISSAVLGLLGVSNTRLGNVPLPWDLGPAGMPVVSSW